MNRSNSRMLGTPSEKQQLSDKDSAFIGKDTSNNKTTDDVYVRIEVVTNENTNLQLPFVSPPSGDMGTSEEEEAETKCDEISIEKNFKTFKSHIASCIKPIDLIAYFDLFTTDQSKKICQMSKMDPTKAARTACEEILEMANTQDKYRHLITALTEAGYPKIVQILKGSLMPVGNYHRQKIRDSFKYIFQDLIPKEVLHDLVSRDVINERDAEEITAKERSESTGAATVELLFILPNRNKNWYIHFIEALMENNHKHLAEIIDEELVKTIQSQKSKATAGNGLKRPPIKYNPYPKVVPGGKSQLVEPLYERAHNSSPQQTSFTNTESNFGSTQSSSGTSKPTLFLECSPCKFAGVVDLATAFCRLCDEYFCDACDMCHSKLKATRKHKKNEILTIKDGDSNLQQTVLQQCHESHDCVIYCLRHDMNICINCARKHSSCLLYHIYDKPEEKQKAFIARLNSIDTVNSWTAATFNSRSNEVEVLLSSMHAHVKQPNALAYQRLRNVRKLFEESSSRK